MYSSSEIINGIKVNDRKTWKHLYKHFYPKARNHVRKNSGRDEDADDLIQNVFYKIFIKCTEGFHHENIMAIIMQKIKWEWTDMLRSRKNNTQSLPEEGIAELAAANYEPDEKSHPGTSIKMSVSISDNIRTSLDKTWQLEKFLDFDKLNDIQKKMISVLLDPVKTNPICRKLLIMTHYLPIDDNLLIAKEMGYYSEEDPADNKKGLDTLKSQKSRCLKKFKESLGLS